MQAVFEEHDTLLQGRGGIVEDDHAAFYETTEGRQLVQVIEGVGARSLVAELYHAVSDVVAVGVAPPAVGRSVEYVVARLTHLAHEPVHVLVPLFFYVLRLLVNEALPLPFGGERRVHELILGTPGLVQEIEPLLALGDAYAARELAVVLQGDPRFPLDEFLVHVGEFKGIGLGALLFSDNVHPLSHQRLHFLSLGVLGTNAPFLGEHVFARLTSFDHTLEFHQVDFAGTGFGEEVAILV